MLSITGGFESFVNSEESKTWQDGSRCASGLRALLIQKRVKPTLQTDALRIGLRALLIQKRVKLKQSF